MEKKILSMEELEMVNGGYKYEKKKAERTNNNEGKNDVITDGIIYMGYMTVEGAKRVWNGIKSLF